MLRSDFFCWLLAGHENRVEIAIYKSYDFLTTSSDLDLCVWAMENLGEQGSQNVVVSVALS